MWRNLWWTCPNVYRATWPQLRLLYRHKTIRITCIYPISVQQRITRLKKCLLSNSPHSPKTIPRHCPWWRTCQQTTVSQSLLHHQPDLSDRRKPPWTTLLQSPLVIETAASFNVLLWTIPKTVLNCLEHKRSCSEFQDVNRISSCCCVHVYKSRWPGHVTWTDSPSCFRAVDHVCADECVSGKETVRSTRRPYDVVKIIYSDVT